MNPSREQFCTQFHPTAILTVLLPFIWMAPSSWRLAGLLAVTASYYASRYLAKYGRAHFFHGGEISDVPAGGKEWRGMYTREFMILCLSTLVATVALAVGVSAGEWVLFLAGNQAAFNLFRGGIKHKPSQGQVRVTSLHV